MWPIDAPPPGVFQPFLYPLHVEPLTEVTVVLFPRVWAIRRGSFQGDVVETPLDPVVDHDVSRFLHTYFFAQAHPQGAPTTYRVDLRTWPEANLPAKVAFDHRYGTTTVTAQDSADIWGVLDRMEEVFGLDLFEPTVAPAEWWPDPPTYGDADLVPGAIRLLFEPPAWGGSPLGSEPVLTWGEELGQWASDSRFTALEVNHELLDGGVLSIGSLDSLRLADGWIPWETVLIHEMLHVLGVGHTCRVASPQGPCLRTAEPSRSDVAYMELRREVMLLEREWGTFLGMIPATIGERRILLGASVLPSLEP